MVKKLAITKKVPNIVKVGDKYGIFSVQRKHLAHINNRTKIRLDMNLRKRKGQARRLKAAKIRFKKQIGKYLLSDIGGTNILKVLIGESSKCYKKKYQRQSDQKIWIHVHY